VPAFLYLRFGASLVTDEKKSLLLHDVVQGLNLLTVVSMFIGGLIFITDIKETASVTSAIQGENSRRISDVERGQHETDTKLQKAVKELREEQGRKLDKLDTKLDRLIERRLR